MDNEIINASLRRSIKSGSQYDKLMPKSTCEVQNLGNGKNNTIEGVDFMADWVKNHSHQVKKLAKTLEKSSLQETVASIWRFLYYHFQYDADGELQKLRSPACSWAQRQSGIDCKSYTILACALLREMGYASYIRQIKQPGYFENEFTHVYAIVPINQSNPPNTDYYQKEYYVIDATVSDNKEPKFIDAKDKLMNGLPYQGMKGKVSTCPPKTAKRVVKASNAGRRLYQGKSSGGRDLAKWRHGSLKAPAENSIITKLYKYEALILALGFPQSTFNAMLQYAYTLIETGIPASQIILFFESNGFKIGVGNRQGRLFKHPFLSGQNYVNKLKEILLKSSANTRNNSNGLNSATDDINFENILDDIDFGNLLDSVLSLFGAGPNSGFYKESHVKENAEKLIELHIDYATQFNSAIQNGNASKTAELKVKLEQTSKVIEQGFTKKKNEGWNSASEDNLQASIDLAKKFGNNIRSAIQKYTQTYLQNSPQFVSGNITFNSNDYRNNGTLASMFGLHLGNPATFTKSYSNGLVAKMGVNVPAFEINKTLVESALQDQTLNTNSWLNDLTNIIVQVSGGGNSNGTGNGTGTGTGNNNQNGNNQSTWNGIGQDTKTSSLVWFGIALAGGYVFRKPIMNALNLKTKK